MTMSYEKHQRFLCLRPKSSTSLFPSKEKWMPHMNTIKNKGIKNKVKSRRQENTRQKRPMNWITKLEEHPRPPTSNPTSKMSL